MRTIVTGIIVFILWSALCTWFYLAYIKGPATSKKAEAEQPVTEVPLAESDSVSTGIQPEISIESPGNFTVHHEFNRSEIIPDVKFDDFIVRFKTYLEQVPGIKLNVTGHTDYVGSDSYNYSLGMRRAKSTKDYLVRMGVPGQIITISSEGESSPVATNETSTGRAKNRRTEIHIIE